MRPLALAIKISLCAFPLPGTEERVWLQRQGDLGVCEGAEALWQILCVGLSPAATFCRGVIWWKLILRF